MRIEDLTRYPVKGLNGEAIQHTFLAPGQALPWDRAFALALGHSRFDPQKPIHVPKTNYMCLMTLACIARLHARFTPQDGALALTSPAAAITENALTPQGRTRIAIWLADFLGPEARGTPMFQHAPGHVFGDQRRPVVSLMNLASIAALEAAAGAPRDRRRFRANVTFTAEPWEEFTWIGRDIRVGTATLRITKRTDRCPATEVNPDTAERDANPISELRAGFGHFDLGVHAEVIAPGQAAPGDPITLL